MFFKKRSPPPPEPHQSGSLTDDDLAAATRAEHKSYTIIAVPRQLHNGNWIVRLNLEESLPDGPRRYDFMGPMAEYGSEEDARRGGVEYAKKRLDGE